MARRGRRLSRAASCGPTASLLPRGVRVDISHLPDGSAQELPCPIVEEPLPLVPLMCDAFPCAGVPEPLAMDVSRELSGIVPASRRITEALACRAGALLRGRVRQGSGSREAGLKVTSDGCSAHRPARGSGTQPFSHIFNSFSFLLLWPNFPVHPLHRRAQSLLAQKEMRPLLVPFKTQGPDLRRRSLPAPRGICAVAGVWNVRAASPSALPPCPSRLRLF